MYLNETYDIIYWLQIDDAAAAVVVLKTHTEVFLNETEDDVCANEDSGSADACAAVDRNGPFSVNSPHVADEAHQLLGGVWCAVIRPRGELQVLYKVHISTLEKCTGQ